MCDETVDSNHLMDVEDIQTVAFHSHLFTIHRFLPFSSHHLKLKLYKNLVSFQIIYFSCIDIII